jgi:hypothetical protein
VGEWWVYGFGCGVAGFVVAGAGAGLDFVGIVSFSSSFNLTFPSPVLSARARFNALDAARIDAARSTL